jgi:hypothetical protein
VALEILPMRHISAFTNQMARGLVPGIGSDFGRSSYFCSLGRFGFFVRIVAGTTGSSFAAHSFARFHRFESARGDISVGS